MAKRKIIWDSRWTSEQRGLIVDLIDRGAQRLAEPLGVIDFETGVQDAERMLNDIRRFPHHFALACVMDRQISAKRAWLIPFSVGQKIGGYAFGDFARLNSADLRKIFRDRRLHRFNETMADLFYDAVRKINDDYGGDAANIWSNNPSSAAIVRRFLQFPGVGPKIANMAANILAREYKIPMRNHAAIDISVDVRVMRYFQKNGFLRSATKKEELIFLARELWLDYPGILDYGAWLDGAA